MDKDISNISPNFVSLFRIINKDRINRGWAIVIKGSSILLKIVPVVAKDANLLKLIINIFYLNQFLN
jgi:hypothetical protein